MLEDLKAVDEEQILLLEDEFRELTMKEAEIFEQLTEVRAAKQRVKRLVAEKRNRYAPIFALPDELLVSIVEAAQQSTDPASALIEVIVSHVSQRFRWAVLGASALWSSIELCWGAKSDEERFAVYLARSRTCTLSVKLKYDAYHAREGCQYDQVHNELATVAQHISRIRRLVLHCGGMGLTLGDAVMHFGYLHAPCLEYVEFSSRTYELDDWEDPYFSIFNRGAPRLTTLKLNNFYPIVTSGNPWISGLTSLDLRGMQTLDGPKILAQCPQLIDLTLDDSIFFIGPPADGSKVSMPSLRSLRALCLGIRPRWSEALIAGVLSWINASTLEVMQFSGTHIYVSQIASFFNLLPLSTFPTLKSLTFANSTIVCSDCDWDSSGHIQPPALHRFSALESLTIINVCNANALLRDLLATSKGADGTPSCGLSSLRTLTLRYKDSDDFGIANWPKLQSDYLDPADTFGPLDDLWTSDPSDPLDDLPTLLASFREIRPIHLRLPRSRFFTERDWNPDDPNFEILDVQPLLRSLEISDPVR